MNKKHFLKLLFIGLLVISCQVDDSRSTISEDENTFIGDITLRSQIEVLELSTKNYTKITGNLFITNEFNDTTKVHDLSPLKSLNEVGSLIIISNDSLLNLNGLENLKKINKELSIKFNSLKNIDGLINLEKIGEKLSICQSNIDNLKSLSNVSNSIENYVLIQMSDLTDLEGLPNIAPTVSLLKVSHTKLKELNFNTPIEKIDGSVEILNNNNLINLNGFKNLKMIKGDLVIRDNDILKTLNDLENINFVGKEIEIKDNKNLINFCVLNNIDNKDDILITIEGNAYNINHENLSKENCSL